MANIYLRLPSVICHYHRNCDLEHKLGCFEPLKFSSFTDHAVVLRSGVSVFTGTSSKSVSCYSQHCWNMILAGKNPLTGKVVMRRDQTEWPSYEEICTINGKVLSSRSERYDFLCIQIPPTIIVGGKEIRTNATYSLPKEMAEILSNLLVRDFKRALLDWEVATFDHCVQPDKIICRGHMDTLERFLMHYDIPIPRDGIEKDTLRRQLARWMKRARVLEKAYRCFDVEYEDSADKVIKFKSSINKR